MMVPPPGVFANALIVRATSVGKPPAAVFASTEVVSLPSSRSVAIRAVTSSVFRSTTYMDKIGLEQSLSM